MSWRKYNSDAYIILILPCVMPLENDTAGYTATTGMFNR